MLDDAHLLGRDTVRGGRSGRRQRNGASGENQGGDRPGPRREPAATTRLARRTPRRVSAVRLWGGHPGGGHGPACRAVPGRGGAASDRPHGARRHDPRFLAASHAPGSRPGRRRSRAPGSWPTAVWPCCPRARRWASPTRRSGRGRPRASRRRPASRRSGPKRSRRSAAPPAGSLFVSVGDRGADVFAHLESVREAGWDAVVRAAQDRRLVQGGGSLTALRAARAMGASTVRTKTGEAVVCVAWRELELLPPRNGPAGRAPIRVRGVRVWNDRLEWLLLTTRPVESLDQALEIISWYTRRWIVEEFHKAWKTGCRAEERRLEEADRLVPLLGALAIVAVRLLTAAGCRPARRRRPGGRAGDDAQGPRGQASAAGRMLRHQPRLSARGRPAGWLPRPQVRRRTRLADHLEGLVRPHDPRRGLRTRPDHHLTQVKCGWVFQAVVSS